MFINLVNTDIPFEEYQITQDKIDALRFRLLLSEGYLNAYELDDIDEEFDCYTIFLLSSGGKLLFLLVGRICYRVKCINKCKTGVVGAGSIMRKFCY